MSQLSNEHSVSPATEADDLQPDTAETMEDGYGQGQPAGEQASSPGQAGSAHPLVREATQFRSRWESVQVSFVDDPRQAVSDAESLVGDVLNDLTAGFRRQRQELESRWNQGEEASTEHLRQTLQRYREFFERLLRV